MLVSGAGKNAYMLAWLIFYKGMYHIVKQGLGAL